MGEEHFGTDVDRAMADSVCFYHPMLAAVRACEKCGRAMCAVCAAEGSLCLNCADGQASAPRDVAPHRRPLAIWGILAMAVVVLVGAGSLLLDRSSRLGGLYNQAVQALFVAHDPQAAIQLFSQVAAEDPGYSGSEGRADALLAAARATATAIPQAAMASATAAAQNTADAAARAVERTGTSQARSAQATAAAVQMALNREQRATSFQATRIAAATQDMATQTADLQTDVARSTQAAATVAAAGTRDVSAQGDAQATVTSQGVYADNAATTIAQAMQAGTATREAAVRRYVQVPLSALGNHAIAFLDKPPTGKAMLGDVPFTFASGVNAEFHTADHLEPGLPVDGAFDVSIAAPHTVYLILGADLTNRKMVGQTVGTIELHFNDGTVQTTDLIVGSNIRDLWTDGSPDQVTSADPSSGWQNVFEETQNRNGKPSRGYLDMLAIDLPANLWSSVLERIAIHDTSPLSGTADPGLQLLAISVLSIP